MEGRDMGGRRSEGLSRFDRFVNGQAGLFEFSGITAADWSCSNESGDRSKSRQRTRASVASADVPHDIGSPLAALSLFSGRPNGGAQISGWCEASPLHMQGHPAAGAAADARVSGGHRVRALCVRQVVDVECIRRPMVSPALEPRRRHCSVLVAAEGLGMRPVPGAR